MERNNLVRTCREFMRECKELQIPAPALLDGDEICVDGFELKIDFYRRAFCDLRGYKSHLTWYVWQCGRRRVLWGEDNYEKLFETFDVLLRFGIIQSLFPMKKEAKFTSNSTLSSTFTLLFRRLIMNLNRLQIAYSRYFSGDQLTCSSLVINFEGQAVLWCWRKQLKQWARVCSLLRFTFCFKSGFSSNIQTLVPGLMMFPLSYFILD